MCVATLSDGEFDPELCPMLVGLSAAERARKLEQPWIKACIERRKARAAAGTADARSGASEPPMACHATGASAPVLSQAS